MINYFHRDLIENEFRPSDFIKQKLPYKGKTFDHIGLEPGKSHKTPNDMKDFILSLERHFLKADVIILDYRYMNKNQIKSVESFLNNRGIKEGKNLIKLKNNKF